jgi:hypothetical protein
VVAAITRPLLACPWTGRLVNRYTLHSRYLVVKSQVPGKEGGGLQTTASFGIGHRWHRYPTHFTFPVVL